MGLGRCPPKCDTNPLTLPEHSCYYPHRSNTNLNISRRNQKPREAHPTHPRTQRLSPSQRPSRRPAEQAKVEHPPMEDRHLLIPPGPVHPSLVSQAMEDAWTERHSGPAIPRRDPVSVGRLAASLRYIKLGVADRLSPAETPSRRLARLRAYAISSKGLMGRLDPRVAHANTISEGATARSLAPIMPAGIQRRGHSRTISPESPCLSSSARGGRASTPRSSPTTASKTGQSRPTSVFHRRPPNKPINTRIPTE